MELKYIHFYSSVCMKCTVQTSHLRSTSIHEAFSANDLKHVSNRRLKIITDGVNAV